MVYRLFFLFSRRNNISENTSLDCSEMSHSRTSVVLQALFLAFPSVNLTTNLTTILRKGTRSNGFPEFQPPKINKKGKRVCWRIDPQKSGSDK